VPRATEVTARLGAPAGPVADVGADLLSSLRTAARARAAVDPSLAGGLRAWLEDGVAALDPPNGRVVVSEAPPGLRLALARTLFCLAVNGVVPLRPFDEALGALAAASSGSSLVASVARLSWGELASLRRAAAADAGSIAAQWRRPPARWLPRTGERICAPLAGGRVELRARADLVLGAPAEATASVCLVGVAPGAPGTADARGRRFLALVETLRSGAPPFRVATYHPEAGGLVAEDVTEAMLKSAVVDVLAHLERPTSQGAGRARQACPADGRR
jgi:hypothetical protein